MPMYVLRGNEVRLNQRFEKGRKGNQDGWFLQCTGHVLGVSVGSQRKEWPARSVRRENDCFSLPVKAVT